MSVVALYIAASGVPDLDRAILGRGYEPLRLAVESDAGNVGGVTLERKDRIRIRRLNIVQLHRMVASSSEVAFVGRNA
jgi:hypothetical protein